MLHTLRNKFLFLGEPKKQSGTPSWKRPFIVTFFFVTLASGLYWLDFFRSYAAEVTVLVVSKNSTSQIAQDIAGNAAELTATLSFYERVLADNELLEETFAGSGPDQRKALWNNVVSVTQPENSSVLIIRAQGETPEYARQLAKQVAQTLITTVSFYYNVKTDIDMRIIDGPLTTTVLRQPVLFGVFSILTSLLVTFIFFGLLSAVPKIFGGQGKKHMKPVRANNPTPTETTAHDFVLGTTIPRIDPKKFVPTKPSSLNYENHEREISASPYSPWRLNPSAKAPANLPVAEPEELPFDEVSAPDSTVMPEATSSQPAVPEPPRGEPTVDEYKRRLNELLAGDK